MQKALLGLNCATFFANKRRTKEKKTCLDRGSNTGPLDLQSNALPTELSRLVHGYQFASSRFFWSRKKQPGLSSEKHTKKKCANRESNPALKLGKLQCYRYTIGAMTDRTDKARRGSRIQIKSPARSPAPQFPVPQGPTHRHQWLCFWVCHPPGPPSSGWYQLTELDSAAPGIESSFWSSEDSFQTSTFFCAPVSPKTAGPARGGGPLRPSGQT